MSLAAGPPSSRESTFDVPGAYGWVAFASLILILIGGFHAIQGVAALLNEDAFAVDDARLWVSADYTIWGWVHIIGGIVIACVGAALFTGRLWARILGVVVATASAITSIAFLPAYPMAAVIMIALDIIVIGAITMHGAELKDTSALGAS